MGRSYQKAIYVLTFFLMVEVFALGFWWIKVAQALPGADALQIFESALALAEGRAESLQSTYYLRTFPFQMGFTLYVEAVMHLFGTDCIFVLQKLNVFFLAGSYLLLILMTNHLFHDDRVTFLTVLFLILFVQPVFLTTFIYGNLPGLFFCLLSFFFLLRSFENGYWNLVISIPSIVIACILKQNYMIALIAMAIVLLLRMIRNRSLVPGIVMILFLSAVLLTRGLPQKYCEERIGVSLGEGTPQGAWLVTGFRESSLCCGWFNSYTNHVLLWNAYDQEKTKAQIAEDFSERLHIFLNRPRYAVSFFGKKLISQWNEPTYQSVWSSKAGTHTSNTLTGEAYSMYYGLGDKVLYQYAKHLLHLTYFGFSLGIVFLIRKRVPSALLLVLVPLGALFYHLIFEAKAQYVLVYIPMMFPILSYGVRNACDRFIQSEKGC